MVTDTGTIRPDYPQLPHYLPARAYHLRTLRRAPAEEGISSVEDNHNHGVPPRHANHKPASHGRPGQAPPAQGLPAVDSAA
jgi:hypothetical protein